MKNYVRVVGVVLGAVLLIWSLSMINAKDFFASLASISHPWLLSSIASIVISIYVRSVRWHTLTGLPRSDLPRLWEATCVGCFGNAIYPARMGDIMRMYHITKLTNVSGGVAIGSNIIDRILEGLGLCCLLLIVLIGDNLLEGVASGLIYIAATFLGLTVITVAFITSGHHLQSLFSFVARQGKIGAKLNEWYVQSLSGLQILRSPKRLIFAVLLQAVVSALDVLTCWLLIQSFGWDVPVIASVMTLLYIAAATSLPSSPGYIGIYQIATLYALRPYGVEESAAVAFGTVLQLSNLVVFICLGVSAYIRDRAALLKSSQA